MSSVRVKKRHMGGFLIFRIPLLLKEGLGVVERLVDKKGDF